MHELPHKLPHVKVLIPETTSVVESRLGYESTPAFAQMKNIFHRVTTVGFKPFPPLFHTKMTRLEGFSGVQRPLELNPSSHIHKDDVATAKTGLWASSGRKVRAKAISMILLHLFVFEGCA